MKAAIPPLTLWIIRIIGLAVFGIAFALPAVALGANDSDPLMGWKCASIALSMPFSKEATFDIDLLLVMLSGWLNVFTGLYLLLCFFKRLRMIRWTVIIFSLVSMASTWVFFARQHYHPLLGHILWIAGAIIILLPEFFANKQDA